MTDSTAPESTLGDVVREARLAAGLSQETLAEMIGRSQGWLTKVERGEIPTPRDESLRRLAAVLGLSLPDLFVAMNRARTAREGERIADAAFVAPWSEEPPETFTFRTNEPDLKRVLAKLQRIDLDRRRAAALLAGRTGPDETPENPPSVTIAVTTTPRKGPA